MEKDRKLERLIRDHGMVRPGSDFTENVMRSVNQSALRSHYRPLIGKFGRILIVLVIAAILVISFVYTGSYGQDASQAEWLQLDLQFRLPDLGGTLLYGALAGGLAALLLVLSDAGWRKKTAA